MTITELQDRRETYGHDERAINRHSVRVYQASGPKRPRTTGPVESLEFHLNRTLDGCPPFYTLYFYKPASALPTYLNLNGEPYWGNGLSWPKAEQHAFKAIQAFMDHRKARR